MTHRETEFQAAWERHTQVPASGAPGLYAPRIVTASGAPGLYTAPRCALRKAEPHCWHEQLRLWDDLFPPALMCCWCGEESRSMNEVPLRHGPHAPQE